MKDCLVQLVNRTTIIILLCFQCFVLLFFVTFSHVFFFFAVFFSTFVFMSCFVILYLLACVFFLFCFVFRFVLFSPHFSLSSSWCLSSDQRFKTFEGPGPGLKDLHDLFTVYCRIVMGKNIMCNIK